MRRAGSTGSLLLLLSGENSSSQARPSASSLPPSAVRWAPPHLQHAGPLCAAEGDAKLGDCRGQSTLWRHQHPHAGPARRAAQLPSHKHRLHRQHATRDDGGGRRRDPLGRGTGRTPGRGGMKRAHQEVAEGPSAALDSMDAQFFKIATDCATSLKDYCRGNRWGGSDEGPPWCGSLDEGLASRLWHAQKPRGARAAAPPRWRGRPVRGVRGCLLGRPPRPVFPCACVPPQQPPRRHHHRCGGHQGRHITTATLSVCHARLPVYWAVRAQGQGQKGAARPHH